MKTLKIEGMSCGHCVRAVERALGELDGVSSVVEVSLERGEARIEGEPDLVRAAAILEDEGYDLVAVDGQPLSAS